MTKIRRAIMSMIGKDKLMQDFASSAFWSVAGKVVLQGLSLLSSIFIARWVGNVSFGELGIIRSTLNVFRLLATFGLGLTITKMIAEKRKSDTAEIPYLVVSSNTFTFLFSTTLGVLLIIMSGVISEHLLDQKKLSTTLMIAAIYLVFNALNATQTGIIAGLNLFKGMAKINVIVGLISFPLLVGFTRWFYINGTLVAMSLVAVSHWYLNRRLITSTLRLNYGEVPTFLSFEGFTKLFRFSYPLALSEAIYSIFSWGYYYLLLQKAGYGELGVFNAASQWGSMILFLPGVLLNVLLSYLSNESNESITYFRIFKRNLFINLGISLTLAILISIFSRFIFSFYGDTYEGGELILVVMVFATIPQSVISLFEMVLISSSKPKLVPVFKFIRQSLIFLLALGLLVIKSNALYFAVAFLAGYTIISLIMGGYVFKTFFSKSKNDFK